MFAGTSHVLEAEITTGRVNHFAQEAFTRNKATLFDVLVRGNIHAVTVEFDGYSDSGQIESSDAFDASNAILALPQDQVVMQSPVPDGSGLSGESLTVHEAIENLAYDLLEQTHAGWEDGEGAFGTFTFSVPDRTITLEHKERFIETELFEHTF